jgi:hypothetical protein
LDEDYEGGVDAQVICTHTEVTIGNDEKVTGQVVAPDTSVESVGYRGVYHSGADIAFQSSQKLKE